MRISQPDSPLLGALLGCAVGDALGLPAEGLPPARVRRHEPLDRFRLLGRWGFVSDDTEQSVLLATALLADDDDAVVRVFRRALLGWVWRLPFGIGLSTLRAGVRLSLGLRRSGVRSAGNGAAMRAPVLGVVLRDERERRLALGRRLAEVSHTHPAGVDGALFCAEVAALAASQPSVPTRELVVRAAHVVQDAELRAAIDQALTLDVEDPAAAGDALGRTGWVVHSAALCAWAFASFPGFEAVRAVIRAGGDTDTHGAIVGAWVGAREGAAAFPPGLVEQLAAGPFGPAHIRAVVLAHAGGPPPRYSRALALLRNLALYPVVLAHGFGRLLRLL